MKNKLAENMLRFGTKNLTESHLKNILTEAKAPVVRQASLLNITPQDLQPFVDKLNGVFAAAAKQAVNKDPAIASAVTPTNQYIQLYIEPTTDASKIIQNKISIIAPGDTANSHFGDVSAAPDFPFGSEPGFTQYKNPPPNKQPDPNKEPGSYKLQKNLMISGTGDFNRDWYNRWLNGSKNSTRLKLRNMFCKNKKIDDTVGGAAAIVAKNGRVKGQARGGLTSNDITGKVYEYVANPYIAAQTEIRAAIEELVEKKYAAFNAAITSQTPE
jgi:hypothetical protein